VLLLSPVLAAAPAIRAETLYVIEQLVVNVNSAPDSSGERVASIKSGDSVEVLDQQGEQVHVHLANGAEGWVKKSYLSAEQPLQYRLSESRAEAEKLKQDVKRLETELATAQSAARMPRSTQANLSGGPAAVPDSPVATTPSGVPGPTPVPAQASGVVSTATSAAKSATVTPAPAPRPTAQTGRSAKGAIDSPVSEPPYFMTPPEAPARPTWQWALGSFVLALTLGYALGWHMLDRRIRRKYGGLRIY
jgi:hypothetical protein